MTMSETDLVRNAKEGDTRAFEQLLLQNQGKIYSLGMKMLGNREDAADLLQETFIKAYQSLSSFEGKSSFSTWLYRIATNFALMKLRKKHRRHVSLDEMRDASSALYEQVVHDWSGSPRAHLKNEDLKALLDAAVEAMPEKYRTVFILHDLQELPVAKIGEILSLSVPAVKSRIHRARMFLRERLSIHFKTKVTTH